MIYLTFLSAILLSGIAGYYSIIGLAAIFVGAFWPVVFMASSMEFAKLVTASWVYRNWKTAPKMLLAYLTLAIVVLMLITSMGIFGFLAKAHIDSTLDAGANTVELKTLNTQQKIAEERLNYLLARAKDPSTASNRLDKQIQDTQKELTEINKKRLPLLKEENKLVADIGPIKYVADMFFEGDSAVDKAVRMVILLIMLVFDPLAVLLLIAGNISLKEKQQKEPDVVIEDGTITKIFQNAKEKISQVVEIKKENLADISEMDKIEPHEAQEIHQEVTEQPTQVVAGIEIDPASGETIPPIEVHHSPGVYEEHHDVIPETIKKLEPKYDYNSEYTFAEKKEKGLDGGAF
jgi:biopolymer transport protein ExbB/TolQ